MESSWQTPLAPLENAWADLMGPTEGSTSHCNARPYSDRTIRRHQYKTDIAFIASSYRGLIQFVTPTAFVTLRICPSILGSKHSYSSMMEGMTFTSSWKKIPLF